MRIVHLTASPFFGGPERQMIGHGQSLPKSEYDVIYWSFAEGGRSQPFVDEARRQGFQADLLDHNIPQYRKCIAEIATRLVDVDADILCCHGYKADILGWFAARRVKIPVISVSRGWTGATLKVVLNEIVDRGMLHLMDRVVCVSEGQARKVLRFGVPRKKVLVIRNAIRLDRFDNPDPDARGKLESLFPAKPTFVVYGAGRLSPEKGYQDLIEAAAKVRAKNPGVGFVVFGEGPLRASFESRIQELNMRDWFLLAGFRDDLDRVIHAADLMILPSYTEGLPNVVLEASASGIPVIATAVGGTPEALVDGETGILVKAGDPNTLAHHILTAIETPEKLRAMRDRGRSFVAENFSFESQAIQYQTLFEQLCAAPTLSSK